MCLFFLRNWMKGVCIQKTRSHFSLQWRTPVVPEWSLTSKPVSSSCSSVSSRWQCANMLNFLPELVSSSETHNWFTCCFLVRVGLYGIGKQTLWPCADVTEDLPWGRRLMINTVLFPQPLCDSKARQAVPSLAVFPSHLSLCIIIDKCVQSTEAVGFLSHTFECTNKSSELSDPLPPQNPWLPWPSVLRFPSPDKRLAPPCVASPQFSSQHIHTGGQLDHETRWALLRTVVASCRAPLGWQSCSPPKRWSGPPVPSWTPGCRRPGAKRKCC